LADGFQGDGSCEYSDDVSGSDYDVDVDEWHEQRRHAELSLCSRDGGSQASYRLSDFDRSTFYDYDDDDDDVDLGPDFADKQVLINNPEDVAAFLYGTWLILPR